MKRIYLDNAATSWPKAPGVAEAVSSYLIDNGAPAGRSGYAEAHDAERIVVDCRRRLAQIINAEHPRQIAMAFNGTDALNMAIHGLLQDGDHVVTTTLEHNSVLRPLQALTERGQITVTYVSPQANGQVAPEDMADALQNNTRLIVLTHVSNVTGAIQPVAAIGALAAGHPSALFLVDAAQSLGHLPVDVAAIGADLLAASAHKGLRGPLGTGLLYVGPRAEGLLRPYRQGGTGTNSEDPSQPTALPERLESGNLNMVGIAGLNAAVANLNLEQIQHQRRHEQQLCQLLLEGLKELPQYMIHGDASTDDAALEQRTGVVSVTCELLPPQDLALLLDASFRIQARAGLHCAPLAHRELGTLDTGGTLRLSFGPDNQLDDVQQVIEALGSLA